ncbi:hypothetical protein E6O75_ATG03349 [Venturia nashicola]|uniref:Uncharacterized protein n=1 Tax=Venturia nashicola TaxID=86259 RepID=A0A4Z1P4G0_9PEZI|nr:hypothetical protein E6O75_ATG03349 [Venturia nashicola]
MEAWSTRLRHLPLAHSRLGATTVDSEGQQSPPKTLIIHRSSTCLRRVELMARQASPVACHAAAMLQQLAAQDERESFHNPLLLPTGHETGHGEESSTFGHGEESKTFATVGQEIFADGSRRATRLPVDWVHKVPTKPPDGYSQR